MKKHKWTTEKPCKPCVVITRYKCQYEKNYTYGLFTLYIVCNEDICGLCVAENNEDWEGSYDEWDSDEYFVIDWLPMEKF